MAVRLLEPIRAFHPGRRYVRMKKRIRRAVNRIALRGDEVACPCCRLSASRFLPRDICAFCESRPRQRFMFLYLEKQVHPGDHVLHFAPEEALQISIRRIPGISYTSADLKSPFAEIKVDLDSQEDVDARLRRGKYSMIVISHVLEHVQNDVAVARRLVDLLKPGGCVLVQVPVDTTRADTYEDWSITSPEGRLRAFGQEDHVRLYGRDFLARFEAGGIAARTVEPEDVCTPEEMSRAKLDGDTILVLSPSRQHP